MISIKRVYPNRRGVGSGAMRVDGTSEYEISGRYDASETATRDDHTGDEEGWIVAPCREKGHEYFLSGCECPSWQSRRPPEVTVRRLWGVVVGVFFETSLCNVPAALPCAIKCRLCGQVFVNVGRLTGNWPPFKSRKKGCVPLDCV